MTTAAPVDPWTFALAFYRQPGVADACLALQNDFGADVVMLIGLCWLAGRDGSAPDAAAIARLDAALGDWRTTVIAPLRALRQTLKPRLARLPPTAAAARERIKDAELASERVAFDLFERAADGLVSGPPGDSPEATARMALDRYLAGRGGADGAEMQALADRLSTGLAGRLRIPANRVRTTVEPKTVL
jgi:uncharacterized protein (TIGR02444 family)